MPSRILENQQEKQKNEHVITDLKMGIFPAGTPDNLNTLSPQDERKS
jgi:hypothetical protein